MAPKNKLELHQIVAFARLLQLNPGSVASDTMCPCNSKCSCDGNSGCCENKCGCDGDTSRNSESDDDERTISMLSDPKYSALVESFDPGAVKTVTDFLNLATQVQNRIKG